MLKDKRLNSLRWIEIEAGIAEKLLDTGLGV